MPVKPVARPGEGSAFPGLVYRQLHGTLRAEEVCIFDRRVASHRAWRKYHDPVSIAYHYAMLVPVGTHWWGVAYGETRTSPILHSELFLEDMGEVTPSLKDLEGMASGFRTRLHQSTGLLNTALFALRNGRLGTGIPDVAHRFLKRSCGEFVHDPSCREDHVLVGESVHRLENVPREYAMAMLTPLVAGFLEFMASPPKS